MCRCRRRVRLAPPATRQPAAQAARRCASASPAWRVILVICIPLSRSCRKAGRLPGNDAAGEMGVVGVALVLRGERGGDRAPAGAAGEHHLLALRIGNGGRIEHRQRHDHRVRIAFDGGLVQLAHIDQQHAAFGQARATSSGVRFCTSSARGISSAMTQLLDQAVIDFSRNRGAAASGIWSLPRPSLGFRPPPPGRSGSGNSRWRRWRSASAR